MRFLLLIAIITVCSGNAYGAGLEVTPTSLSFGRVVIKESIPVLPVKVKNTSSTTQLVNFSVTTPFKLTGLTNSAKIPAGSELAVSVTIDLAQMNGDGPLTGTLTIVRALTEKVIVPISGTIEVVNLTTRGKLNKITLGQTSNSAVIDVTGVGDPHNEVTAVLQLRASFDGGSELIWQQSPFSYQGSKTTTATLTNIPKTTRNITIRLVTDPQNKIIETNETDNSSSFSISLERPDLEVTFRSPAVQVVDSATGRLTVRVTVINRGTLATGECTGIVTVTNGPSQSFTIPALAINAVTTADITITPPQPLTGSQQFQVRVDSQERILELREDNNSATFSLSL